MRHWHFDDEKYQIFEDATHESLDDETQEFDDKTHQDLDDEVSIHYRGFEQEVVDSDEISAKADLSNRKGRGKSAPKSTKWTPHGNPIDITGQEGPYEEWDEEWKGKAPMREFDILSNERQGSHACV